MASKVKVIDQISNEVIAYYDIKDLTRAYEFAADMEEMGLDIRIDAPDIHQTLGDSLGVATQQLKKYREGLQEEIDDHDTSLPENKSTPSV